MSLLTTESFKISAVVISYNRRDVIATAVQSVAFADEIIVVDKSSTDGTPEIASRYADRVISVPWSPVVEETRAMAVAVCSHEWVVCIDDDECFSPESGAIIAELIRETKANAIAFPLCHYIMGMHDPDAYYWPEHHIRLFKRSAVDFVPTVHGGIKVLTEDIFKLPAESPARIHHLSHRNTAQWIEKANRYTSMADRRRVPFDSDDIIAFAHQNIDQWVGRSTLKNNADYPAAVAVLRASYDIIDRLKCWEEAHGIDGVTQFENVTATLSRQYVATYPERLGKSAAQEVADAVSTAIREPAVEPATMSTGIEINEAYLKEKSLANAALRARIDAADIETAAMHVQIADKDRQIAEVSAQLNAVVSSLSWRVTRPLRESGTRYPFLMKASRTLRSLLRRG